MAARRACLSVFCSSEDMPAETWELSADVLLPEAVAAPAVTGSPSAGELFR
jgi:hypothetical protein